MATMAPFTAVAHCRRTPRARGTRAIYITTRVGSARCMLSSLRRHPRSPRTDRHHRPLPSPLVVGRYHHPPSVTTGGSTTLAAHATVAAASASARPSVLYFATAAAQAAQAALPPQPPPSSSPMPSSRPTPPTRPPTPTRTPRQHQRQHHRHSAIVTATTIANANHAQ